ncbi:MAG: AMP-binding protein, partial [Bacteroidales bacterium]|nr:AMP-binding protein [Bacteroidales bacterium]
QLEKESLNKPFIGNKSAFSNITILDKHKKPCGIGMPGDIYVNKLFKEYSQNISQNLLISKVKREESFIIKTGDLGRITSERNIEYLGSVSGRKRVRNYYIDLNEIEESLKKQLFVKDLLINLKNDKDELYCYVEFTEEIESKSEGELLLQLKNALLKTYSSIFLPDVFIVVKNMPKDSSGQIDKRKLLSIKLIESDKQDEKPSLTQSRIIALWSEVLGVEESRISIKTDFFEVGGQSLKGVQLISKLYKEFNVRVPLVELFKTPTVEGLDDYIKGMSVSSGNVNIDIVEKKEYYHLSAAQARMFFLQQMDLKSMVYNMPDIIPLEKGINRLVVKEVFQQLIDRHESFRTAFIVLDGVFNQKIYEKVEFNIDEVNISEKDIENLRHKYVKPFDLSKAPLIRAIILNVENSSSFLYVDMHHIISDGTSRIILKNEFTQLLKGQKLKKIQVQYKDYSEWQISKEQKEIIKNQEAYWLGRFSNDLPILNLPVDYSRPAMQSQKGAQVRFTLSKEETEKVKILSKENGLTLYMGILSIYTILLSKLSGQEDIIVGTPIAGRNHADLDGVVGMFVNTLAMRNNVDQTLRDFLQEIKQTTIGAFDNQDYQFEDLVEKVLVERDTSRNPLFDVMFNLLNYSEFSGDLSNFGNDRYVHTSGISKFDLTLVAVDYQDQLLMTFEYCTELFKSETIERYIKYFKNIIYQLEIKKDEKISSIEIITEEEKQLIINKFNNTRSEYCKETNIHGIFEEEVRKNPKHIAIVNGDKELTYGELNENANQIAHYLIERGVNAGTETIVGIELEPSYEFVVCMIGVLKSGGAYLPIDKNLPKKRKKYIVENSKLKVLIHSNSDYKEIDSNIELTNYKDIDLEKYKRTNLNIKVSITNLAYVIYTSGTSGNPKGTLLEHKGIVSENTFWKGDLEMNPLDRCIQFANISFDGSVWEICSCLLNGASLYIPEKLIKDDARLFENYLISNKITVAALPPVYAENLNEE